MKQYVGIIRDHSGSMGSYRLGPPAARDYNAVIAQLKEAATAERIETIVSVVKCGARPMGYAPYGTALIDRIVTNRNVHSIEPMHEADYDTRGGNTPLFDSVGELITLFKGVPDYSNPDVCFLIMATTDGEDNASPRWKSSIAREMRDLQATDRWTFVYRVPAGYESTLQRFGVHPGNIAPWEQSEVGLRQAQVATTSAISNFYTARRTTGIRSSSTFYTDVASVPKQQVAASMTMCPSSV